MSVQTEQDITQERSLGEHQVLRPTLVHFASQLAHELNVPLSAILVYSEELVDLAQKRYGSAGLNQLVEYLEHIQRQVNLCKDILHHLVEYAKTMDIHLEEVDLNVVMQESLALFEHEIAEMGTVLNRRLDPDLPAIRSDKTGLRRVLINFLTNAIKAAGPRGEVSIQTELDGDWVKVIISNSGTGITKEEADRLMSRAAASAGSIDTRGLGLLICDGILKTLGGRWSIQNRSGGGTVVCIEIQRGA